MSISRTYHGDEPMRVNKWLGQTGICSRREAEGLIEQGLISIDGETLTSPGHKIQPGQTLTLNQAGKDKLEAKITAVLNKPVGYVSAQPEGDQTPAARLIRRDTLYGAAQNIPSSKTLLAPLGRLDMDSRGLLLLSEDGVLAKAIIGPDSDMEKEYLVRVRGKITPQIVKRLCFGLHLDGRKLRRARVTHEGGNLLRFILKEGRNRQIRRMCEIVGLNVEDLQRIRIGALVIGDLPEGMWRPLNTVERDALLSDATN